MKLAPINPALHIGQMVKWSCYRMGPNDWEAIEETGRVVDPCVKDDPIYLGEAKIKLQGSLGFTYQHPATVTPVPVPPMDYPAMVEAGAIALACADPIFSDRRWEEMFEHRRAPFRATASIVLAATGIEALLARVDGGQA